MPCLSEGTKATLKRANPKENVTLSEIWRAGAVTGGLKKLPQTRAQRVRAGIHSEEQGRGHHYFLTLWPVFVKLRESP